MYVHLHVLYTAVGGDECIPTMIFVSRALLTFATEPPSYRHQARLGAPDLSGVIHHQCLHFF
jgi:hypothetical protein